MLCMQFGGQSEWHADAATWCMIVSSSHVNGRQMHQFNFWMSGSHANKMDPCQFPHVESQYIQICIYVSCPSNLEHTSHHLCQHCSGQPSHTASQKTKGRSNYLKSIMPCRKMDIHHDLSPPDCKS